MSERPAIGILTGPAAPEAAVALALAAAMPGAMLVSLGWRFGRAATPGLKTAPAALDAWLAGKADRPRAEATLRADKPHVAKATALPDRAIVIVCGLEPWAAAVPRLLARRPDLRAVALITEPVACSWPEYRAPAVAAVAQASLGTIAAKAALVVVPERGTADSLHASRTSRPILVEPLPSCLAGTGAAGSLLPPGSPMVACGPIEARANTLLLLHVWRDGLTRGAALPKLVLAGPRGQQIEEIAPLLDWNAALRPQVTEAPGLSPAALRRLVEGASAVLVPDFARPPAGLMGDLVALDIPVIAADTPTAQRLGLKVRLDPLDGPGWREAIATAARTERPPRPDRPATLLDWPGYATRLLAAIRALP